MAGKIAGKEVATKEGAAAMSQISKAKPIEEIKVSEKDFRNPNDKNCVPNRRSCFSKCGKLP